MPGMVQTSRAATVSQPPQDRCRCLPLLGLPTAFPPTGRDLLVSPSPHYIASRLLSVGSTLMLYHDRPRSA